MKNSITRTRKANYTQTPAGGGMMPMPWWMCQRYTFRTQPTGLGHYNFRETAGGESPVFSHTVDTGIDMEPLRLCWIIQGMK